ncbi:MAG: AMP-dependent synthetase [Nocardioides sp.]|nr:AMP-dependent synthetase [Nocardioides sp.]
MPVASDLVDLPSLLADAARESPEKLAVVEAGGRGLTWAELDQEAGRVATGLGAAGVVAGQRVALVCPNRLEFVTTYLAVLRAQAVAVPINPRTTPRELGRILLGCAPRLVVADGDTVTSVREAVELAADAGLERAPRVVAIGTTLRPGERSYDHLRADRARPVPPVHDLERLAALLYTSGATGVPRGAMLTHRALAANVAQVAEVDPPMVSGDDVVLGVLPLFHVYGLNAVLGGVLRHRAKLVLTDQFHPEGTLDLIDDEAVSVVPIAPPVLAAWSGVDLEGRLGPVRLLLSGSAPLDPATVEAFVARTGIPVHEGYGLTEAAPVVTSTLCSTASRPGGVGAPLEGVELRLVDDDDVPAEPGDPGEIQVRGDNLFSGYWPDGDDAPDVDGWWSTGDVGYLDDAGDLHLVDRVKDLVIVSGFNVYPAEVEGVVAEVEGVRAVAVVGAEDARIGEAVVAYVVAPDADPVDLAARVTEHCGRHLARFKVPTRVEVVEALPHTVTGKVQKGRLRRWERRRADGAL